ncbi:MAG: hypothetical protein FWE32_05925 [Oscillospiraceae bacterium]|nr:hypothetical protein [Oscillospiraceae bacterium]
MPDYAKLYRHLFNALTDAIALLQKAHQQAEEMYITAPDPDIRQLNPNTNTKGGQEDV